MRVGLVGCVKSKLAAPAPASELYTSPLSRGRRAAVEVSCDSWYVLSPLHGLVPPARVLEPYDLALTGLPAGTSTTSTIHRQGASLRSCSNISELTRCRCVSGRWRGRVWKDQRR
jgi:hypothetical protein